VTTEHGLPSFALDGLCRYWISGAWTNHIAFDFLAWRTGEAPAKLVCDLEALLDLKRLNTLAKGCVPSGIFDAAPAIIASEESFVGCVEFGGTMEEAWNLVDSSAEQLYDQGTSLDGAVRIVVLPAAPIHSRRAPL
jgi:hypothetical protein